MSSDESNLAESAYELINSTDGESQDGQISESVSSLDFPRTDDVHSLNGSTNEYRTDTDEEEEDDDHHSSASSIRYADQALQNPSTQTPSGSLQFRPTPEASMLPQSIEFHEAEADNDGHVYVEKISVKHAIREFDERETATIAQALELTEAPKRLVATIRQTMSQACLSTRTPLRVMYTGSPAALKEILYKLSSAIWTSGATSESGKADQRNDAVYNIVPISSFGSTEVPEFELMGSSGYQIRVEHCTGAEEMVIDGGSFPGDTVFCVTIDHEKTYRSLFSPSGSIIQPKWTLPHVAIFFCTENDDEEAERTRDVAWEFMSRHGVPSIFICNNQTFTKPASGRWRDFVDQHAVHMCLESRDPDRPILPQRLPIDLQSFLNIDARQMNRNLAYLTGLSDPVEESQPETEPVSSKSTSILEADTEQDEKVPVSPTYDVKQGAVDVLQRHRQHIWSLLITALGVCIYAWLRSGDLTTSKPSAASTAAIASVSTVVSPTSASTTTTTVIINVTSTKTVNLQRADASASPLASALSFAGLLSDRTSTATIAEPEATNTVCSVERYGDNNNELLVRIPTSKKSAWLAKGAIDIDVFRGEEPIKAKLSSVDEGIVVELNKKDAYGVLNVSVITTRKPRINETFEVNLGNSAVLEALEAVAQALLGLRDKAVHSGEQVLHSGADVVHSAAESIAKVARSVEDGVRVVDDTMATAAGKIAEAGQAAERYTQRTVDSLHPRHLVKGVQAAQKQFADRVAGAKAEAELTVLKAQIASKLWSLKVQGKTEEYAKYEQKAADYLKKKNEKLVRTFKSSGDEAQQKQECGCSSGKRKPRHCPKKCASARKATPNAGARWKKLVVG
ncbi:glycosyltransferase family 15 protein [Coniochaeta hoffmannii]|uniref:Glycosyltransferase family 15 protein n=1 Tax=Coniochaeta hoffmannii TaxID=91930 RepID=A0AA38RTB0_9PEZI|nr:glycosyltransferase family 15 protein [Coniochaeta hoffmannii]